MTETKAISVLLDECKLMELELQQGQLRAAHDGEICPAQVRAARGLLGWSQGDLAREAGLARRTVVHFEADTRRPHESNVQAIRKSLEDVGIIFIDSVDGWGVLLKRGGAQT